MTSTDRCGPRRWKGQTSVMSANSETDTTQKKEFLLFCWLRHEYAMLQYGNQDTTA